MHIIQITWFILPLMKITLANLDTCSLIKNSGYTYNYEYEYYCTHNTISCNNITNYYTTWKIMFPYDEYYCNELTVTNSNLSNIGIYLFTPNFYSVVSITLFDCKIETINENTFSEFTKTVKLNLKKNKIKNLEFLDYFVGLKSLTLAYNELSDVSAKQFKHLRTLEILNLAYNNLTSIGNSSYMLGVLKELYLNNNNIVEIVAIVFQKLNLLKILSLAENKIELISEGLFDSLKNLQKLYLQKNHIKSITSYPFYELGQLNTLDVSYNSFLNLITNTTFHECNNLLYVNFSNSNISTIESAAFPKSMSLKSLDLSNNKLKSLNEFLQFQVSRVYLHNNPLTLQSNESSATVTEILDLSGCNIPILRMHFLTIRRLGTLKLNDTNLSIIEQYAFEYVNIVEKLDLSRNKIEILESHSFEGLVDLQILDLSQNPIIKISPFVFSSLRRVSTLWLSGNNLTVGNNSFYGLENLQYLSFIKGQYLNLKSWSFHGLENIKNLQFINTTIGNIETEAFYGVTIMPEISLCPYPFQDHSLNLCNVLLQTLQSNAFKGIKRIIETYNFSNNNITRVVGNTFSNLKMIDLLDLSKNNIVEIESFAFHNINFCSREDFDSYDYGYRRIRCFNKSIYLNNMKTLQVISKNAFTNIYNLKALHLEHSNTFKIESFAFQTISFFNLNSKTSDASIYLNYNNITSILKNTFNDIANITNLYLDHNKISKIESNAFRSVIFCETCPNEIVFKPGHFNININCIHLNDNLLVNLTKNTFKDIHNLIELHLENNEIKIIENSAFSGLHMHKNSTYYTEINLNNNKINKLLEGTFTGISNLCSLSITDNYLTTIEPKTFSPLNNLLTLDLSSNNLSLIDSNTFFGLFALQTLFLDNNKLLTLTPDSFKDLSSLLNLWMTNNLIEEFPLGTFKHFPLLNNLELGHNYLSKFKIGSFSNLAKLERLDLSHNKFETLDESILYPLHKLDSLDLSYNKLSYISYTSLLTHNPTLKHISINDNRWNCKFLINMLKDLKANYVLYVSPYTNMYDNENVDGIACSETDENVEQYTTRGPDTIKTIYSDGSPYTNKFPKFIENFDSNIKNLISEVQRIANGTKLNNQENENQLIKIIGKLLDHPNFTSIVNSDRKNTSSSMEINNNTVNLEIIKENSQKLLFEMQTFLNLSILNSAEKNNSELLKEIHKLVNMTKNITELQSIEFMSNKNEIKMQNLEVIIKENTNEVHKLRARLNENFTTNFSQTYKLENSFGKQKLVDNPVNNIHEGSSNYEHSVLLYLVLLISLAIFCLLGFITYQKYLKLQLAKSRNQRSEMELIEAN